MSNCRQVWLQALPFQQFHVLFHSLSKVLFIFRSLYLCAIGLWPIFSFRRNLPPILSCIPKQLDSSKEFHIDAVYDSRRDSNPLCHPVPSTIRSLKQPDFKFELLPLHSPLLRQSLLVSFPPLIDMLKFSGYSYLIRGQHLGKSITRPSSIRVVPDTCLVKSSSYPVPSGAPSLSLRPVDRQSY